MKNRTKGATLTVQLLGQGVDRELLDDAMAIKCVAALLADPETPLDPAVMAKKMGATEGQVRVILQSPVFAEVLRERLQEHSMGCMARSLTVLNSIVCDKTEKTSDRIAAARVEADFYKTAANIEPKHVQGAARDKFLKLLNRTREVSATVTTKPDDHQDQRPKGRPGDKAGRPQSSRVPRPRPASPEGDRAGVRPDHP